MQNTAVVLGVSDTGYGIVRSLAEGDISITGFEKDFSIPEVHTRLCRKIYTYNSHQHLLEQLIDLGKRFSQKPALFFSSDPLVSFCSENRTLLSEYFQFHLPDPQTVKMLMEKQHFQDLAVELGCRIPKTVFVNSRQHLSAVLKNLEPPFIIKPYLKSISWKNAGLEKAIIINRKEDLLNAIQKYLEIESNLVIQEYVPGGDDSVFFCLVYFDENSECLASFTGRKIRQWPSLVGDTASAIPFRDAWLQKETIRFFKAIQYKGFGSMEFKRHPYTQEYFMIEPTVGRADHQSYIATANSINISLIAYASLVWNQSFFVGNKNQQNCHAPVMWIDEPHELAALMVKLKKFTISSADLNPYFRNARSYRFFTWTDPLPFVFFIRFYIQKALNILSTKVKQFRMKKDTSV